MPTHQHEGNFANHVGIFSPDLNIIVLFETFGVFFITMKRLKVTAANYSINDEHIEILKIIKHVHIPFQIPSIFKGELINWCPDLTKSGQPDNIWYHTIHQVVA